MSDCSFSVSDKSYSRYLFEYRHKGSEWGIEITATSPDDAVERLNSLAWARYQGEVKAKIPIPTGNIIKRFFSRYRRH